LRRVLINQAGDHKSILARGEQSKRMAWFLFPVPKTKIHIVRWICEQFTRHGKREAEITADLN
jgi:hypothetical protein